MGQKTRNFGSGTRDMKSAGEVFAERSTESFSSAATLSSRFSQFVDFAKENGIKKLENVTKETVEKYAKNLKESGLAAATQQNYLSAVNVVMQEARGDQEVRVTGREAGLEQRSGVATEYKGKVERQELSDRTQTIVDLARNFGLRFEEASKIDARSAIKEAISKGSITVDAGTKGGQPREVPITNEKQIETLKKAAEIQGKDRSMIAAEKTYAEHKRESYRETTSGFHSERHDYANERYSEIMKENLGIEILSPVLSDKKENQSWSHYVAEKAHEKGIGITPEQAREFDKGARLELSMELGHNREDVVSAYIGGQK